MKQKQNYVYKVSQVIKDDSATITAKKVLRETVTAEKYDCFHLNDDHGRYASGFKNGEGVCPDIYDDFFYTSCDAYYWAKTAMEDWINQDMTAVGNFVCHPIT